jgi:hypothetical protein
MIDYPSPSDEAELRSIWKDVFGDSDETIDLFSETAIQSIQHLYTGSRAV